MSQTKAQLLDGKSATIQYTAGSASSPAISFTGDTNTGIYSPGADQVAISTGGTGRLFVDASGSIIVNTSTSRANITGSSRPSFQIEGTNYVGALASICRVSDSAAAAATLAIAKTRGSSVGSNSAVQSGDTLGRLSFEGNDGTVFSGSASITAVAAETFTSGSAAGHLLFNTTPTGANSSTERLRITSAGLVGVGVSSPQLPLTIGLGGGANPATSGSTQSSGGIARIGSSGAAALDIGTLAAGPVWLQSTNVTNLATNYSLLLNPNGGNVGIGTTSPADPLHVVGRIRGVATNFALQARDTGSSQTSIGLTVEGLAADKKTWEFLNDTSGNFQIRAINDAYTSSQPALFVARGASAASVDHIYLATAGTERARIDSSGRLLVGTSSSLAIGGSSHAIQNETTGASISATRHGGTDPGNGAVISLSRSRGTTSGSANAVLSGDALGYVQFCGADGANFTNYAAWIACEVDGTPFSSGDLTDLPGRLIFATTADGAGAPTERMRIANTGETGIFAAAGVSVLVARSAATAGTADRLFAGIYGALSNVPGTGFVSFQVWSNGNVQNTNNSYTAISDIKLKENVVDANSQWDDIKALQVRNYNLKEGQTHKQIGLIAQEVELVSPGLVYESPDRDAEGNDLGTTTKSVNYSVLYMKAVKALQEAMERIETLEAKVATLESA